MTEFSIWQQLKKLRYGNGLTLKMLSSRVGYGTGNLSSYETGALNAMDPTLLRILTRGYRMSQKEARQMIAGWRQAELQRDYHLQLGQKATPYNQGKGKKTLEQMLADEGLNRTGIAKIKQLIRTLKKK